MWGDVMENPAALDYTLDFRGLSGDDNNYSTKDVSEEQLDRILAEIDDVPDGINRRLLRNQIALLAYIRRDGDLLKLLATREGKDKLKDIRKTANRLSLLLKSNPVIERELKVSAIPKFFDYLSYVVRGVDYLLKYPATTSAPQYAQMSTFDWLAGVQITKIYERFLCRDATTTVTGEYVRFAAAVLREIGVANSSNTPKAISDALWRARSGKLRNRKQ